VELRAYPARSPSVACAPETSQLETTLQLSHASWEDGQLSQQQHFLARMPQLFAFDAILRCTTVSAVVGKHVSIAIGTLFCRSWEAFIPEHPQAAATHCKAAIDVRRDLSVKLRFRLLTCDLPGMRVFEPCRNSSKHMGMNLSFSAKRTLHGFVRQLPSTRLDDFSSSPGYSAGCRLKPLVCRSSVRKYRGPTLLLICRRR